MVSESLSKIDDFWMNINQNVLLTIFENPKQKVKIF